MGKVLTTLQTIISIHQRLKNKYWLENEFECEKCGSDIWRRERQITRGFSATGLEANQQSVQKSQLAVSYLRSKSRTNRCSGNDQKDPVGFGKARKAIKGHTKKIVSSNQRSLVSSLSERLSLCIWQIHWTATTVCLRCIFVCVICLHSL